MGIEIERKFLVTGDQWRDLAKPTYYCQGYLNRDPHRTVRVRIAGEAAFLTVKGISKGASRAEFEYSIPVDDARQMLELCDGTIIEKQRSVVDYAQMTWEIDEFLGENLGLLVAEIELDAEDQPFELPPWAGREVTGDRRYYNANLSEHPFSQWK